MATWNSELAPFLSHREGCTGSEWWTLVRKRATTSQPVRKLARCLIRLLAIPRNVLTSMHEVDPWNYRSPLAKGQKNATDFLLH
jgi:hypothetical protein